MIRVANRRVQPGTVAVWVAGMLAAALWAAPIAWMYLSSFKPESQITTGTTEWLPREWILDNYVAVFKKPVLRWFFNSALVGVTVTVGALAIGSMAGYALARLRFPGRGLIFLFILAALMVPSEMTLVPLYVAMFRVGLINSYLALILPSLPSVFCVYLFRQFFLSLPRELEEAALIDGANRFQTFFHIAVPLARPAAITATIIVFVGSWNSFLWPLLVMMDDQMYTAPVGMARFNTLNMQQTNSSFTFGTGMAAMSLLALPTLLLFVLLQRQFIQGVTSSGVKG